MAKKQLNKKIVVGLTLFGFLGIILVSVVMLRRLQERDPKYYTDLAEQYADDEDYRTAALFYKEAWDRSQDPADLVLYGQMLLEQGEVGRALAGWQDAIVNDPTYVDAHRKRLDVLMELAKLYGLTGDWSSVEEAAEGLLQAVKEPTPTDAAFAKHAIGLALVNLGRHDEEKARNGEEALREAVRLAPDRADYAVDLAEYLARSDRLEEAQRLFMQLLDRFTAAGAQASSVRVAYAKYLVQRERFDAAEKTFKEALQRAGDDKKALQEARLGYASVLSRQWAQAARKKDDTGAPLFEKAEQVLTECRTADEDQFEPYLYLAYLYNAAQRYQDVADLCEQRLSRGFSRNGIEAARNRLSAFTLMLYASESCVMLAAKALEDGDMKLREEMLARAEQYVTDARGEFPNHPAILAHKARVKLARGEDRAALEDLRRADEAYRSFGTIHWDTILLLARVHLRLHEPGAARAVIEGVLDQARKKRASDPMFWSLYARTLLETNDLNRAQSITDQILAADPANNEALRIRASLYERQGRRAAATQVAEHLTEDPALRAILKARQQALEGQSEQAIQILRKALETAPTDARLLGALIRELSALDRVAEAQDVIQRARSLAPDDLALKRLTVLADPSLTPEARDQALLETINAQPDGYQRALELIGYYRRKEDDARTLTAIDAALEHFVQKDTPLSQNAAVDQHRALLDAKLIIAGRLNDDAAQRAARDEAKRYNVDGAEGEALSGLYYMLNKEYARAAAALRRAITTQPTDARSLARLGQCLQLLGQPEKAREQYEEAIHVNPREGTAFKGLASLAKARDDAEAYREALKRCEQLIPEDPWVRAAVEEREEEADPAGAIAKREKYLAAHPDDAPTLRKLADLCEKTDRLDRADAYYEKLAQLRPDDKALTLAISRYYRRTHRDDRALAFVTRFAESRRTPAERANGQILIAAHYMERHQPARAERALLQAADIETTFEVAQSLSELYRKGLDDPERALPWTEKAVTLARSQKSKQLPLVLTQYAALLLDRRVKRMADARRVLDDLLVNNPTYAPARLLDAQYHARVGQIDQAVNSLTDYLAQNPDDPQALYQRALHRCSQGRFVPAMDDLEALKRAHPLALDLKPRLLLAQLHKRAGRIDAWLHELETLAQDAPDNPQAVDSLVRAYLEQQRLADAERILAAQMNRPGDHIDARWFFLRGRLKLDMGKDDSALIDYQRGAEASGYSAAAVVTVLDAFLHLGRTTQGLAYYQQHAPKKNPPAVLLSRHARLLALSDTPQDAIQEFRRAMSRAEATSDASVRRVSADLLPTYKGVDAISLFKKDRPSGSLGRANDRILVRLYRTHERFDEAISVLNRLIATAVDDAQRADLLVEMGDVCQASGSFERAREAYTEALKYKPDQWITLNNLAYLLSDKLGEHRRARAYAQRAVQLSDSPDALDTLGWIYVGLQDYPAAIAELSRAIRVNPDDPLSYYHLGEAYRRQGKFDQATDILESGRKLAASKGRNDLQKPFDDSIKRVKGTDATP